MPGIAPPIKLSEPETSKLEIIASRPKSLRRDAERARIILRCASGDSNKEAAEAVGVTP